MPQPSQVLSKEPDVRTVLQRRFDMCTWFKRNGFPVDAILENAIEAARQERLRDGAPVSAHGCSGSPVVRSPSTAVTQPSTSPAQKRVPGTPVRPFLILTDFDKTLTDYDAGACCVRFPLRLKRMSALLWFSKQSAPTDKVSGQVPPTPCRFTCLSQPPSRLNSVCLHSGLLVTFSSLCRSGNRSKQRTAEATPLDLNHPGPVDNKQVPFDKRSC